MAMLAPRHAPPANLIPVSRPSGAQLFEMPSTAPGTSSAMAATTGLSVRKRAWKRLSVTAPASSTAAAAPQKA